jgi:hypothetical protein
MSGVKHWYQRRSEKRYAPRLRWTAEQRLAALERIAEKAECGEATPLDEAEAVAHMAALGRTS